ncbi:MAG TPA: hypothetical protein VM686_42855, partial [Polyangiaceae bacterium]|nr:hypothetical protein [Polyangiaceae bacterium]
FYFGAWPSYGTCPTDGCLDSGPTHFSAAPAVSVDTDSQYIYVAKHGWGEIHRCELPDCADDTDDILVTDTIPLSVAVDETTLYFAAYDLFEINSAPPPGIFKCPLDGCGTDEPEIVREALSPYAIAVNERRLFYTDVEQGTVTSLAK